MARLTRSFFERTPLEVAPELLGSLLVYQLGRRRRLAGRIVEVEAYLGSGDGDPASHAFRGPTARNRAMFGAPGSLYVYRSMGLHVCANLVCEPAGRAGAVLLRAVEPLEGLDLMRQRRRRARADRDLCSGPGKLSAAFGIALDDDGRSLLRGPFRVEQDRAPLPGPVLAGPRIGISRATDLPFRFFVQGCPHVTRSPLNRLAVPWAGAVRRG